ncbi:MAG: hypothetical protein ACOX9C_07740 [Kiritimatiellia bacterium]|jgi:hypothetical protein
METANQLPKRLLAKSPQSGHYFTMIQRNIAALKELREQLGKRFITGVVLYIGDNLIPFGDQLWLVPLPILWAP